MPIPLPITALETHTMMAPALTEPLVFWWETYTKQCPNGDEAEGMDGGLW